MINLKLIAAMFLLVCSISQADPDFCLKQYQLCNEEGIDNGICDIQAKRCVAAFDE